MINFTDLQQPPRPTLLIVTFLILSTLTVYINVYTFEFLKFDDNFYVTENKHVKAGLTKESILWAFTTTHANFWHPFIWLSHMLTVQMFGLNAGAHHLVNLLLHIVNSLLLFTVLHRITDTKWRSGLVAALFALHPLHVESVAWIAARKDLLSAIFWFIVMWSYVSYTKRRSVTAYLVMFLLFICGLMAKPMLVTLPLVLLIIDYYPLKRLNRGALYEKIPLIAASFIFGVIAYIAQKSGGAVGSSELFPLKIRVFNALFSYMLYTGQTLWPVNLSVFYPHPGNTLTLLHAGASMLLLTVITIVLFVAQKRVPLLMTGWLWFLVTLLPVIGVIQIGSHAMADRYTYIPLTGLFIIFVWGGHELLYKKMKKRVSSIILAVLILFMLSLQTRIQVKYWVNDFALFTHALTSTERNYVAHNNLGNIHSERGEYELAEYHYTEALRVNPDDEIACYNLAIVLEKQGKYEEALSRYRLAVKIKPDYAEAHNNLGKSLARTGKKDEAINHFSRAIAIKHDFAMAHNNLGVAMYETGRNDIALIHFKKAIEIDSGYGNARKNYEFIKKLEEK